MTKLKYLIKSEDKLMAVEERDEIESFYNRLRFLGAILKDMEEKRHKENDEGENLAMQIRYVTYKIGEFLSFFVAEVAKQRDSNNNGKSICLFYFLSITNILEQIKPIELKAMQFYDKTYQIQLLQDEKSFDKGPSMSIGNRTMVEEESMVGFDQFGSSAAQACRHPAAPLKQRRFEGNFNLKTKKSRTETRGEGKKREREREKSGEEEGIRRKRAPPQLPVAQWPPKVARSKEQPWRLQIRPDQANRVSEQRFLHLGVDDGEEFLGAELAEVASG